VGFAQFLRDFSVVAPRAAAGARLFSGDRFPAIQRENQETIEAGR
jgi:hypothetical protein